MLETLIVWVARQLNLRGPPKLSRFGGQELTKLWWSPRQSQAVFDPACEACRAFHPVVKEILSEFQGKVRVVLRYTAFHPPSEEAIKILEAARIQGKFEVVLERLLETQPRWAPHGRPASNAWNLLDGTGLDLERARRESQLPDIAAILNQDAADVKIVGIRGTPTFFVNGKPLPSFGAEQLYELVREEVESARH